MTKSTVNKKELDKLIKNLEKLPINIQDRVMTSAVRAGAKAIQKAAIDYAPIDTGALRKSIKIKKVPKREMLFEGDNPEYIASYRVGIDTEIAWYANIVEFGSVKMAADPFMTPAYELNYKDALTAMKSYLIKRIQREINKLKGK